MAYESEKELELLLVKGLEDVGFQKIKIQNEQDLSKNFRDQMNTLNREALKGKKLSDKEFERLMLHIGGKSTFKSSKILRDKIMMQNDSGENIYLKLLDMKSNKENNYQVTSQVTEIGKFTNRYDVTLLINGLPLIQIELKRRGLDLKEAFNQICRYKKHSYEFRKKSLFRFIQFFVISNGVETKYFINSSDPKFAFTFYWTDSNNTKISNLKDFVTSFLKPSWVFKMIKNYIVLNESEKSMMILRPYQVHAVDAILKAEKNSEGGYIWHTTGSGKTLTSFKASRILSEDPSIKKVIFVVDRSDLDNQTTKEFNNFEEGSVDGTDTTSILGKHLKDPKRKLLITTIQKLSNAISRSHLKFEKDIQYLKNEKIAIIFDECHRSTFGTMFANIKKEFSNAKLFGFTGTPRFIENKSQTGQTTADVFGKNLHKYLIKNAISDHNVLSFSVEYINTIIGNFDENDGTYASKINREEVWLDNKRIKLIAEHIISHHNSKTINSLYTAIFATQSIPMLIKYYDNFKAMNHNLKIAAIFTYGSNEDSEGRDEHSRDSLKRIIDDYNQIFDKSFSTDSFSSYNKDIAKKVKLRQIDILIVVGMYLTGFDSPPLNTLYVDKTLKYHDLLQAYSRTNRIEKVTKQFGNIVCYRNLKQNTDDAIKLFSDGENCDDVLLREFKVYMNLFKERISELLIIAKLPSDVDLLVREEDIKKFIISFRNLASTHLTLTTFTEFEFDSHNFEITEQQFKEYKSKYHSKYEAHKNNVEKISILSDIDFAIELITTERINVSYIMNLLREVNLEDKEIQKKDIYRLSEELDRSDSAEVRKKIDLIKEFLHEIIPNLNVEDSIDDAYNGFENERRELEIREFCTKTGLLESLLKNEIREFEYTGILNRKVITDSIDQTFLKKVELTNKTIEFIKNNVQKYE